jgi:hypothetical protein
MSIHDEFLQIVRILAEPPESAGKKPPFPEIDQPSEATSDGPGKCCGATMKKGQS